MAAAPARRIAVTAGDPAGIGPDILLSAWASQQRGALPALAIYADSTVLGARAATLGLDIAFDARERLTDFDHAAGDDGMARLAVVHHPSPVAITAGTPDPAYGPHVIALIEAAVADVANGDARALVTAPIAKSVLQASGFPYPGHTEFLGALAERHWPNDTVRAPQMMLASDDLKVVPLTIHVPLTDVPVMITDARLSEAIETVASELQRRFHIDAPRIAVTGLNPHAGEDGRMGLEDRDIIAPVIERFAATGLNITGPHAADTLFHSEARATYDVVIAMYHDQALIPIKTLAFDTGVNVTLGLPFVRTSPDHGTAFALAGTGRARASSFLAALRLADQLSSGGSSSAAARGHTASASR